MSNIIESIKLIYPGINGGFSYWETKKNGEPLDNKIDGLIWDNKEYEKPTWTQIESFIPTVILNEVKSKRTSQLKANRDASLEAPMASIKAMEYGTTKEVYFEFRSKSTGIPLTDPVAIIDEALRGEEVTYSCYILEGNNKRKGYVKLDSTIAKDLKNHLKERAITNIKYSNDLEIEINSINLNDFDSLEDAIEAVNNINIDFE